VDGRRLGDGLACLADSVEMQRKSGAYAEQFSPSAPSMTIRHWPPNNADQKPKENAAITRPRVIRFALPTRST
jgi:hypothetical protein